ncbi:TetR/AcrR family transcriptional regulator [Algoriphagus machipongonensis]|uniref:Transcriptional regulator, TetR family n=1 Tax=Algoriphagus machipongonensis TaxID=388413 RepID=A3HSQ5_9BACT|nr:TetR/AcrR family transcriptional regulator [Algoriphagus machipongonensis]EAZ82873.1 putative transcriptional regulator, TetR family [Algoriphagus machipongonensis]
MEYILKHLKVEVSDQLYIKEPFSSELGTAIVKEGSKLLLELGMEHFTFKKLSEKIGGTEPAIYRYFENKHKFLLYLTAWYWAWMEHNLVLATANLEDPYERLGIAIRLLVNGPLKLQNDYLNPNELRQIVINESLKGYLTKSVDLEHESGVFSQLYHFSDRISAIITEISPTYKHPKTLVSTVMEASLLQAFHILHLPNMTEFSLESNGKFQFFYQMVTKTIVND